MNTEKNPHTGQTYTPDELKILFEAMNQTPSYLSKRFVLKHLLGWSDDALKINMQMMEEENNMRKIGQKGGY
jgi:hypothetical protein